MSYFSRFWRWIARHWFKVLSCVAIVGFGVMYAIYPQAAKIMFLAWGGMLLLLSFVAGCEKVGEAREDTRIYSIYSDGYRAKNPIPGEAMKMKPTDLAKMTKEERADAVRWGWVEVEPEQETTTAEWEKVQ